MTHYLGIDLGSSFTKLVAIDADGVIVLINARAEKLFGYRREELLGQAIEMLVPPRFRGNHPRHRSGFFLDPRARSMGVVVEGM